MKLKDKMTLRDSQKISKWYEEGLEQNMGYIISTIATNDDGSEIEDVLDCNEEELLMIFAEYISKKNKLMKNFTLKISE